MLYHIYEAQRSLLEPFADFAQATAKLYSNPLLPLSKSFATQRTVAAFDLFYRLAKDYEKPQLTSPFASCAASSVFLTTPPRWTPCWASPRC